MPWPKLQFSLRGLALAVLMTGVVLSHAVTSRRLAQTQQELSHLRQRHGLLDIKDPTKLQLQQVTSAIEPYTWEWELYLPDARDYKIHIATRDIPVFDLPPAGQYVRQDRGLSRPGA